MKRIAQLATLCLSLLTFNVHALDAQSSIPNEFMESLSIGKKDIHIKIPHKYQIIMHDAVNQEQTLGFVPDGESLGHWQQYISITIANNTSESAAVRIKSIENYLERTYPDATVIDMQVERSQTTVSKASATFSFTDDTGPVILSAIYYADSSKLVGTQVSKRVKKSEQEAIEKTKSLANAIIVLQ